MQKEAPINKILSKLDDSITRDESHELDSWRHAAEENESFYKAFKFLWNDYKTGRSSFEPDLEKGLSKTHLRISRRQFIRKTTKIAAVLVALISISSALFLLAPSGKNITITTDNQQQITLPDGTLVILAQGSQFTYPAFFNGSKREVKLNGKAWFDVSHRAEQPFIVETHNARTKVLGTQFTITAHEHEPTAVFLDEGKVAFQGKKWFSESHILKPGEMISFENGSYHKSKQNNLNASSWATQKLKFKSTALIDVIHEIESYYMVNIDLQTPQTGQLRFSGTIKEPTAYEALEIVALTLNLKLTKNEDTLTLSL